MRTIKQTAINMEKEIVCYLKAKNCCGEPAMVAEGGGLRCPRCWLAEKGKQIKPLDHAGYYP